MHWEDEHVASYFRCTLKALDCLHCSKVKDAKFSPINAMIN